LHELCCRRFGAERILGCHERELKRLRRVTVRKNQPEKELEEANENSLTKTKEK